MSCFGISRCDSDSNRKRLLRPAGAGPLAYPLTAAAFFASVVPIALGLFQTFAAIYAREARKVDVHRPSEPETPPSEAAASD